VKDGDPQGDGAHGEVESDNGDVDGTSFRSPMKHQRVAHTTPSSVQVMPLPIPELALHSPSTIIGTPFATDSPFEYPFPDNSNSTTSRDALPFISSLNSLSPSSSFPPLSSGSSLTLSSSSSSQSPPLTITPPSVSPLAHFPPDLPQNYSPTHPKLRPGNPPVPPGLIKKRQRWNLGLLRRRGSSGASSSSAGPSPSPEASMPDTTSKQVSNPLRLPRTIQETEEGNTKMQRSD